MERSDFVKFLGINAFGAAVSPALFASNPDQRHLVLTVNDLNSYLRSLHQVRENSVDRIIIGNPDARVTKIGTCWMPYWKTLKEAVAMGVNTLNHGTAEENGMRMLNAYLKEVFTLLKVIHFNQGCGYKWIS